MNHTMFDDFNALMIVLPICDDAKVWKNFISIPTELPFDDNFTPSEKDCLDHLNTHLFEAITLKSAVNVAPKLRALRTSLDDCVTSHRCA